MAAFKRLEAPGLPYRKETVRVYNGQAEFRMTYEFLPPDRRRYVNHPSDPHYESETIEIGERTWARFPRQHEGWSEVKAKAVLILDAPKDEPFACLGPVAFNGKTYLGYRRRAAMSFVRDVLRPQAKKRGSRIWPQFGTGARHNHGALSSSTPQACSLPTISWLRRTNSTARA
jgi:hypothetical protein